MILQVPEGQSPRELSSLGVFRSNWRCLCHGYDVFMTRVMLLVKGEDYGYSTYPGRLTKHKKNPTNGSYDHQFISSLHHTPLFL